MLETSAQALAYRSFSGASFDISAAARRLLGGTVSIMVAILIDVGVRLRASSSKGSGWYSQEATSSAESAYRYVAVQL